MNIGTLQLLANIPSGELKDVKEARTRMKLVARLVCIYYTSTWHSNSSKIYLEL